MSVPARPPDRPWEPTPLELPLERPRPPHRAPPSWDGRNDGPDDRDADAGETEANRPPGSHVVVIDIA